MELSYECKACKHRWDGGLHDDVCPLCGVEKARITWTDEDNDPPDGYSYEGGYDDDNDTD
jgi:hypothetical protein